MGIEEALLGKSGKTQQLEKSVAEAKRRMLKWKNPVEYVNNMYGCHPDDEGNGYFVAVFGGLGG